MDRGLFLGDLLTTLFERRGGRPRAAPAAEMEARCHALMSERGEVSGLRLAQEILAGYRLLDDAGRLGFFRMLADAFDLDADAVADAARTYSEARDAASLARLTDASEPARQELLRRLNQAPGGTAELVRMRVDLLALARDHPDLARADQDFAHLFRSWFNRGFLVLRHVDWDSPARLLEKIISYEAVHAINDWDDLRRRLDPPDRRCFAFFHPAMPEEPLIFVEVALTRGVPGSIQDLLSEDRTALEEGEADTAVFYSISNCQAGLKGISFGNSLIKQVVTLLGTEVPHLRTFVTLSPIPGLARWLDRRAEAGDAAAARLLEVAESGGAKGKEAREALRARAARYLLEARRADGQPLDPVARFHLGNGAQVHEVHAAADLSENGLKSACGAMVNYLYDPARVEAQHEAYAARRSVAASRAVRALARAAPEPGGAETAETGGPRAAG
jgi:malonyl-CoA decarboxylase